jgi:CRISPR-associated protein Cmr6
MPTQLMREALRPLFHDAREAHPGLLIQRGYPIYDQDTEAGREAKTRHLQRICAITPSPFYHNAYQRWRSATADALRFRQLELALESRLFIGLTGGGMLETGCAISHSYGMPYIPGSSVKGVVRAQVRDSLFGREHPEVIAELFGSEADPTPDARYPQGLSGLVTFHDAWWVPGSADRPLVEEIVTTHHLDYYGREGRDTWATDFDSPIPNAQIAVHGHFLFVLEGPPAWLDLAQQMLLAALSDQGIGAKTRTGYGLFDPTPKVPAPPPRALDEQWHGVDVRLNPGSGELTVDHQGRIATIRESDAKRIRDGLPQDISNRLRKQRIIKNCHVHVERIGNAWRLVEIQSVGDSVLSKKADGV